jgi:multiple sugar transport system substrate-binding protein
VIELHGMTWDHVRGRDPLLATAAAFERERPNVKITWHVRSLHDFGHHPVDALAREYDLVVLDHPWVGFISDTQCYLPLDTLVPEETLRDLATGCVGPSHASYTWSG